MHLGDGTSHRSFVHDDPPLVDLPYHQGIRSQSCMRVREEEGGSVGDRLGRCGAGMIARDIGRLSIGVRDGLNDLDVKCAPGGVGRAESTLVDGHVLGANGLGVDAVEQRDGTASEDARREVPGLGGLFGRFGDDGHWGAVE